LSVPGMHSRTNYVVYVSMPFKQYAKTL
jgi:hypothetical protein